MTVLKVQIKVKDNLHFCTTCFNAFSSWYFPKNPDNGSDLLSRNRVSLTAPEMNSSISLPICGFSKKQDKKTDQNQT